MENKGHSRAKKSTEQLNVSIESNLLKEVSDYLFRKHQNISTVPSNESDLEIKSEAEGLLFHFYSHNESNVFNENISLSKNRPNIYSAFQLLAEIKQNEKETHKNPYAQPYHDKRTYLKARKKFEQVIKKSRHIKRQMGPLLDISADDQEIDQLFDESHSIETVLLQVLKLTGFKTYHACQLIIHEKGKAEAESIHTDETSSITHSQLSAKKFNVLYRLIKKSKNKHFNQTQILDTDLSIVGPFLAKEIETKEHDLIFIISRNGFLSPSLKEQNYFFSIIPSLKQVFRFILTKSKLTQREQLLAHSFNYYPFPILLSVGGNVIFKNRHICDEHLDAIDTQPHSTDFYVHQLGVDKKLFIFPPSEDELISDFNHHQRIALLGELLNTLKHELSNPLFGLKLTADILASDAQNDDIKASLDDIAQNALRCQSIIDNFSNLYVDQEDLKKVDLNFLIREIITLTKSETRGIPLKFRGLEPHSLFIRTHTTWLTQIVFNLIVNASQAIKSTGRNLAGFEINVGITTTDQYVTIFVKDTGPGVPEDLKDDILRPYFTTKSKGTGLGLAICSNLALRLNAKLEYHNNTPSPGATFSIHLPQHE